MAYTHKAVHLLLGTSAGSPPAFDELEDAITAAETYIAGTEAEDPKAYIVPATQVVEV